MSFGLVIRIFYHSLGPKQDGALSAERACRYSHMFTRPIEFQFQP